MMDVLKYRRGAAPDFECAASLAKSCGVENNRVENHPMNSVYNADCTCAARGGRATSSA